MHFYKFVTTILLNVSRVTVKNLILCIRFNFMLGVFTRQVLYYIRISSGIKHKTIFMHSSAYSPRLRKLKVVSCAP